MLLKFKNKTIFTYIIIIKNGSRLRAMHFTIGYLLERYWYLYPNKILHFILYLYHNDTHHEILIKFNNKIVLVK